MRRVSTKEPEGTGFRTIPACSPGRNALTTDGPVVPQIGPAATIDVSCPRRFRDFVRGYVNGDGSLTISDAVVMARALFGLGEHSITIMSCEDAADTNDDGTLDLADPIFLLGALLLARDTVPPPTACGRDPTPDSLSCNEYVCTSQSAER